MPNQSGATSGKAAMPRELQEYMAYLGTLEKRKASVNDPKATKTESRLEKPCTRDGKNNYGAGARKAQR
jgi:hypothetical protein